MRKYLTGATALGLVLVGGFVWFSRPDPSIDTQVDPAVGSIVVPNFNALAKQGEAEYNGNCAACHGVKLAGTAQGPTLIHSLYRPSHHADGAIVLAAINGVRAHHWQFGDMPAVEGITPQKLTVIIAYIRAMQQANGIR